MAVNSSAYFLPYQIRWLQDNSRIKIWEKSRRIGATYVQAYEDVRDAATGKIPAVWFSSADETAAREYILYCEKWVKLFDTAARSLGQIVIDSEKNIKALVIELANGARIHALSSNPKAFRSKGGKVILDEFAFHDDADSMWAAARPVITWGYPLRILSTHNGKQCRYYRFIQAIKKGKLKWSHHKTDIFTAVKEGLVDKILGHPTTPQEREAWLEEEHQACFDEDTWLQEYCCVAVDEASAFLPYQLIQNCQLAYNFNYTNPNHALKRLAATDELYVGMDIARKKHFSVIWGLIKTGLIFQTAFVIPLHRQTFKQQKRVLFQTLRHPALRRAALDATGLGMQLAEEAQEEFGKYRVEAINFSGRVKEDLAYTIRNDFEDRAILIPDNDEIREDLHSLKKITTVAGNIRFDVAKTDSGSHADYFWALALARHAAANNPGPIILAGKNLKQANHMLRGFHVSDFNDF
ncbi:MAG: terminase family protein [Calditrichia bacterium]